MRPLSYLTLGLSFLFCVNAIGARRVQHSPSSLSSASNAQAAATARIVSAAEALLATLDAAGRAKAQFPFDGPQKTRWSNFPTGIFHREGLRMGDLTQTQRKAVMTLLSVALSDEGLTKVNDIVRGDEVLRTADTGGPPAGGPPTAGPGGGGQAPPPGAGAATSGPRVIFGEDEYYLAFVGAPSTTAPWMLQFGGHHLAINLTMAGSDATMAPSLPAAQPASYSFEGRTVRPLGDENDKAFTLINALDDKAARAGDPALPSRGSRTRSGSGWPDDSARGPSRLRPNPAQQTMLVDLVREWVGIMNDAFAEPRMAEITEKLPDTYFAWSGPTTNGSAAYFRIQGPTLVIEYAPQRSVDHIHTIFRDPTNDYGAKFTRAK